MRARADTPWAVNANGLHNLQAILAFFCLLPTFGCMTLKADFTKTSCRTYVLYPPLNVDEQVSDQIASQWQKKYQAKSCAKLIDPDESKAFLRMLGSDHTVPATQALADEVKRARLVRRFKATHVITLSLDNQGTELNIAPKVFALSPFVEESLGDLPASVSVSQKDLTAITRRHPLRHFFKGLNLLPNSFATGFGGPSLGFETSVKNVHTYEERERSQLPAFVAATAIRRIQHRYQYDTFDTSGDWFGYLLVNYIDSYAKWTPVKDPSAFNPDAVPAEERYDYIVEGMVVGPVIGYEVAVYSPLGTYGIGLGFGLGISGLRDSFQERRWKGHFLTVVSINYRAFITDRLFSTLTFSLYGASPNLISNDHFDIGGRGYFLLGLGYYFPESSSMARKIL